MEGTRDFPNKLFTIGCHYIKLSNCRERWLLYGEEPIYDDRWALLEERAKELGEDIYQKFLLLKATKKKI